MLGFTWAFVCSSPQLLLKKHCLSLQIGLWRNLLVPVSASYMLSMAQPRVASDLRIMASSFSAP